MIYSYIVAFLLLITSDLKTSAVTDCFSETYYDRFVSLTFLRVDFDWL